MTAGLQDDVVESEHAEILRLVGSRTVPDLLAERARENGDSPAYVIGDRTLDWSATRRIVLEVAGGFAAQGVGTGTTVGLMLANRVEHILGDLAALHLGACTTTMYTTSSDEQLEHVAVDAEITAVVLDQEGLARFRAVLPRLPLIRTVILTDDVAAEAESELTHWTVVRWNAVRAAGRDTPAPEASAALSDATAVLIYTSGTTGVSKGVPLTHRQLLAACVSASRHFALPEHPRFLSYLPLAHVAERVCSLYLPVYLGGSTAFCADMADLLPALQQSRPTMFFGVPRVWEKIRQALERKLAEIGDAEQRIVAESALADAREAALLRLGGHPVDPDLAARADAADSGLLAMVRAGLGLDRCAHAVTGGAAIAPDIEEFFIGLGVPLHQVYGASETAGAAVSHRPGRIRPGTVGEALPGVHIRLADDGEILVRSPFTTSGYRGLPDATRDLFTDDGYLRTGDIGTIDDGFVSVTDRKKELIITAGGKNIGPVGIESRLVRSPLVGQALAYGDGRRYLVALLTLDREAAVRWAVDHDVAETDPAALCRNDALRADVQKVVDAANAEVSRVEQIKNWTLLSDEWTTGSGELTPTLKVKRRVVHANYASDIDDLYST